jgi:hypothetical protein
MPSENLKHSKNIIELKPMYSIFKQIQYPQFGGFGFKDFENAPFCLGWSLVTEPFVMVTEPHVHDFDQYLFFTGGDPTDVYKSFDGELEFGLEGVIQSINFPTCIYVPKGTVHGPYIFKTVNKPMMFMDIVMSAIPSVRPPPPGSRRGE